MDDRTGGTTPGVGGRTDPSAHRAAVFAWLFGIVALVGVRFRSDWPLWVDLHRWLHDQGVPDWVRAQDGWLVQLLLCAAGAALAARQLRTNVPHVLWLRAGAVGWLRVAVLASLPMLVGGALLGWWRGGSLAELPLASLLRGGVRAPVMEELLCRGLLVGVVAVGFGARAVPTWLAVGAGAVLFGMLHLPWNWQGMVAGWATLLVTGIGGIWFAWLMLRWRSLWPPMLVHATMNLGWQLGQASGGAGGGALVDNLLRVATIVVATIGTVRRAPR